MVILGIETSCDETAAAIVEETGNRAQPWRVLSSVVASQVAIHRNWGGVVPELASRQHIRDICGVVDRALVDAGINQSGYQAIAVTQGPGLIGSLLVGLSFAKSLAWSSGVSLVPVHHLAGHIESLVLHNGEMPLPASVLVVSGGHTNLYHVPKPGVYELLGRTRDDAAGEAYDKVAKLLGLEYPGGPVIDRLACSGNDRAVLFPKTQLKHVDRNAPHLPGQFDFSFSGLKTSVSRYVASRRQTLGLQSGEMLPNNLIVDICASFQRVVVEGLVEKLFEVAQHHGARSVGIAGGVSANTRLRSDAIKAGTRYELPVFVPSFDLSTDNAAMIAAAGLRRFQAGATAEWTLNADATLSL